MATLFQQEEELLQPISEEVGKSFVLSLIYLPHVGKAEEDANEESDTEGLEVIDFSEVGRLQAEVDAAAAQQQTRLKTEVNVVQERFTGFYIDTEPTPVLDVPLIPSSAIGGLVLGEQQDDEEIIVYVAPHPRAGPVTPPPEAENLYIPPSVSILTGLPVSTLEANSPSHPTPLISSDVNEVNVTSSPSYPVQRSLDVEMTVEGDVSLTEVSATPAESSAEPVTSVAGPSSTSAGPPAQPLSTPIPFESLSFSFQNTIQKKIARRIHPSQTPRSLIKKGKPRKRASRRFGSYGANMAEAHLQEEARDPRQHERRVGDSDLDWGDESEAGDGVDELSSGIGAMDIDPDIDLAAMASFAKTMSAEGSRQTTIDDIADEERIRREDEEGSSSQETDGDDGDSENSEDEEVEMVVSKAEKALIAEGADESEEGSEDESDEEDTPRRGFQTRLRRIREITKGKRKAEPHQEAASDDEDEDPELFMDQSWADEDEEFIAHIEAVLDANGELLSKDHIQRNKVFRSIHNGISEIDDYEQVISGPAKRKKDDIAPELQDQWEKDRAKKAENKRKRALQRLEVSTDPLAMKKGGKKGMKDMLTAARLDPSIEVPNRVVDLVTLEQQIRRFLDNIGGKTSMVLPPANKETRKKIHELAIAFNLRSQSKGQGKTRYTTLIKTTRSGVGTNEGKVRKIMKSVSPHWEGPTKGGGKAMSLAKHKEGEEVGKAAPKIGETNIGFRMLASMGWVEGDLIGLSGGLEAPLTAIMKKTKLGLGATL
ncbi:hypothetical protein EW026_g6864 [Hermanssonia centrifuga]|uniref:Protein SQS1 n=1 Tax=Hermanssonia centrifuga TaxID=98765 RepID=A0A4S4K9N4_9APHY|nr:hypothetical protein EW026_g6864 [Hermanssonia centrifuga]